MLYAFFWVITQKKAYNKLLILLKGTLKARSQESYLKFHSVQLDWGLCDSEEDGYIST